MSSELDYELNNNENFFYKEKEKEKYYSIHPPITGILRSILVKKGDRVKGNQIVGVLECMKTFVEVRTPEYMEEGEVVWTKECCYEKPCVVQQNEELVRVRIKEED